MIDVCNFAAFSNFTSVVVPAIRTLYDPSELSLSALCVNVTFEKPIFFSDVKPLILPHAVLFVSAPSLPVPSHEYSHSML